MFHKPKNPILNFFLEEENNYKNSRRLIRKKTPTVSPDLIYEEMEEDIEPKEEMEENEPPIIPPKPSNHNKLIAVSLGTLVLLFVIILLSLDDNQS